MGSVKKTSGLGGVATKAGVNAECFRMQSIIEKLFKKTMD